MNTQNAAITSEVREIMLDFAEETGIASISHPPRRYLWTDAHAVCNFLSLYSRTRDDAYKHLGLSLIDQVHTVLGKHRTDDPRTGWISGLREEEGRNHPTAGGLRIGKKLNERGPHDELDERLEWDRDGQYFHYLTKWMHALCRASAFTGEWRYCRWALELAKVAHAKFSLALPGSSDKRLLWKMSIDLSYPLVLSSGLHDPLDAFITYHEIRACAKASGRHGSFPDLDAEIAEAASMIEGQRWHTDDPLGLGGLLFDTCRLLQLSAAAHVDNPGIAAALATASAESLDAFARHARLNDPPEYRLAFRELGLSIGLKAVPRLGSILASHPGLFADSVQQDVAGLARYLPLAGEIERFWSRRDNQKARTWLDHLDINRVMLATSLLPDEFLDVGRAH